MPGGLVDCALANVGFDTSFGCKEDLTSERENLGRRRVNVRNCQVLLRQPNATGALPNKWDSSSNVRITLTLLLMIHYVSRGTHK